MTIDMFQWAVYLLLDCIGNLFSYFRTCLDATGIAWTVIVSLFVYVAAMRFIAIPFFGRAFNLSGASDTVNRVKKEKAAERKAAQRANRYQSKKSD